jgi:hypothetical protein
MTMTAENLVEKVVEERQRLPMGAPVGRELLREMIEAIGRSAADLPDTRLTGALAARGAKYRGELMWVGRALNGWTKGWLPRYFRNSENVTEVVEGIESSSVANAPETCSLRWVTEPWDGKDSSYNPKRSAFWRAAKAVLLHADETDVLWSSCWSSRLVWSNLYKIAPLAGGNPGDRLAAIQLPFCRDLLMQEIDEFKPERLVFATGLDWADTFLDHPHFVRSDPKAFGQYVEGLGDLVVGDKKIGKFVIAPHPQGKNGVQWVQEVMSALNSDAPTGL